MRDRAVFEGDSRARSRVKALLMLARMVPFELVQLPQHDNRLQHLVQLAMNTAFACRDRGRIDAEIEERTFDRRGTSEREMAVHPQPGGAVERSHQRAVEEDQFGHDTGVFTCVYAGFRGGV